MYLILFSLVLIAGGVAVWVAGGAIYRRASRMRTKAEQKQWRRKAEKLGAAARILFVIAAVMFVFGFILLQGAQLK